MPSVVILVDSKIRDLMGISLIAHHLEQKGMTCHIEPLESWRACVGAWKPDFILFNHLNAPHLADFSVQCKEWGILTGVLPNEGIFYVPGDLEYSSRKIHAHMHCDLMLCWSELHRDALAANHFCEAPEDIVPVGVPRFDFYKSPWKRLFEKESRLSSRPVVLVNANFPLAYFVDLPEKFADNFFAQWKDEIPIYSDYKAAIRASYEGLHEFPPFLDALLAADKYFVIVRPHPREDPNFYLNWIETLDPAYRKNMRLALKDNITELVVNADIEVSCENCTTTLEAWIAGKPTVGLAFKKHPFFYTPEVAKLLPECEDPFQIVEMVDRALAEPAQQEYAEGRQAHMEKWLYKTDGRAAERVALEIEKAITGRRVPKRIRLNFANRRRGIKLRLAHLLGEPVHVTPKLFFRRIFKGDRGEQTLRYRDYLKAVKPAEVRRAKGFISSIADQ